MVPESRVLYLPDVGAGCWCFFIRLNLHTLGFGADFLHVVPEFRVLCYIFGGVEIQRPEGGAFCGVGIGVVIHHGDDSAVLKAEHVGVAIAIDAQQTASDEGMVQVPGIQRIIGAANFRCICRYLSGLAEITTSGAVNDTLRADEPEFAFFACYSVVDGFQHGGQGRFPAILLCDGE